MRSPNRNLLIVAVIVWMCAVATDFGRLVANLLILLAIALTVVVVAMWLAGKRRAMIERGPPV